MLMHWLLAIFMLGLLGLTFVLLPYLLTHAWRGVWCGHEFVVCTEPGPPRSRLRAWCLVLELTVDGTPPSFELSRGRGIAFTPLRRLTPTRGCCESWADPPVFDHVRSQASSDASRRHGPNVAVRVAKTRGWHPTCFSDGWPKRQAFERREGKRS